jgi:hypothetical protein
MHIVPDRLQPHPSRHTPKRCTAIASRVWAEGVRGWMVTPRLEGTKPSMQSWAEPEEMWTGLPAALGVEEVLKTADDAAALLALLRAKVNPLLDVAAQLRKGFECENDSGAFHNLSFRAFKLAGIPDTTFVWRRVRDPTNALICC